MKILTIRGARPQFIKAGDETEWIELVDNRYNVLASADKIKILNIFTEFEFNKDYKTSLYGAGQASAIIIKNILNK